jgi:hypothetical protein
LGIALNVMPLSEVVDFLKTGFRLKVNVIKNGNSTKPQSQLNGGYLQLFYFSINTSTFIEKPPRIFSIPKIISVISIF